MPKRAKKTAVKRKADSTLPQSAAKKKVAVVAPHVEVTVKAGRVMVMGQGDVGQLGLGEDITERKKPAIVKDVAETMFRKVVCGGMHTVALTHDGEIYTWGCNDEGALGHPTSSEDGEEYHAAKVELPEGLLFVDVCAGDSHTVALTDKGDVYAWGTYRDMNGSVGLCPDGSKTSPVLILSGQKDPIIKIDSGNDHTVALTESGKIFTWGCADQGQLGRIKECFTARGGRRGLDYILRPGQVRFRRSTTRFKDVFCGSFHTFAVAKQSPDVYAWGLNNYGQLGTGNIENWFTPTKASPLTDLNTDENKHIQIASGQHHSVALDAQGKVFTFGRAEYGRLGLGEDAKETSQPTQISTLDEQTITQIACGDSVSFAITTEGNLYSWGMGSCLQLGSGEDEDSVVPALVEGKNLVPAEHEVLCVDAGGQHTALVIADRE